MDASLPPQPLPDAPAPPPGEEALRSRRWMRGIWGIGGVLVVFALMYLSRPVVMGAPKNPYRTEATSNAKQIGLALMEFESEYGSFPSAATAAQVKAETKTPLTLGDSSSNELFRQLIAVGVKSEKIYYAKGRGIRKGDDVFHSDRTALARGECGFAYIAGLSSASHPETPVVLAPMIRGTTKFDPRPFSGQAVVLRVDGSTMSMRIDSSGQVKLRGGVDLFDSRQPFWGGKAPEIKWQE